MTNFEDEWLAYETNVISAIAVVPPGRSRDRFMKNAGSIERIARELVGVSWPHNARIAPTEALSIASRLIQFVAMFGPMNAAEWIAEEIQPTQPPPRRKKKKSS